MPERRNVNRKDFTYYMQLVDHDTQELVGHLVDISTGGFKLDSPKPLPLNKDYRFRMELTSEVADKPAMIFIARSRWCQVDPIDPFVYNVGFQVISIKPDDNEIMNRIVEKYGTQKKKTITTTPRNSNRW